MFGIFEKPFNELSFQDITELVARNERESQFLEYKERFMEDDITSDICAMANAQGGYILIGVSEKPEGPGVEEGYPDSVVGIADSDRNELILREKLKDLIDPCIQRVADKVVRNNEGKSVLLIQIPNSQLKPHFVRKSKKTPFPIRVGRTTSEWTMGDVKAQILSRADVDSRIEKIINQTVRCNPNYLLPEVYVSIIAVPTFWGTEIVNLSNSNIQSLIKYPPGNLNGPDWGMDLTPGISRYCLEGIENRYEQESYQKNGESNYLRLHRIGLLEYGSGSLSFSHGGFVCIKDKWILSKIVHFANCYKSFAEIVDLYDPVTFDIELMNISNCVINPTDFAIRSYYHKVLTQKRDLRIRVTYPSIFENGISRDLGRRFYNAFGIPEIPNSYGFQIE